MTKDECFELGYVQKIHGLSGEVTVVLDVDYPEDYEDLESVFLEIKGSLVPYFIKTIQVRGDKAIVGFDDITTPESAEKLKGAKLFLPLEHLPELDDEAFYFHEIIGFTVIDNNKGKLGTVANVYNLPHQDLIAMDYKQKEVLIPLTDDIVLSVDRETKEVVTELPDGLLEIYLEEQSDQSDED